MKVTYRLHLFDREQAKERLFVREVDPWPFPSLPVADDAVFLDVPGSGEVAATRPGAGVTKPVKRVIYVPHDETAIIEMHAVADPNRSRGVDVQVEVLLRAGFREVPQT